MISESYIKDLLLSMGYIKKNHIYEKFFPSVDCYIKVDLKNRTIIYPEDRGMTISNRTTCNFSAPENFVVLECVTRLFDKGYRPKHLNLEKEWTLGHESKGGRADICVSDQEGNTLFIVECKTYGREYEKEYKNIVNDGGQLFSYWQQERSCKFLVLYASKYEGKQIKWDTESIDCSDDANIVALSQKDDSIKLFKNAHTVSELYSVWDETYEKRFSGDVIFRDDSSAYQIGVKPLRKADLKDFADNNKIVNKFEEILRHNNVSDKENAFNRLVALFICKLVDEIQKDMEEIVDFQYKVGTDTYESLQDRLQRLHKEGMEKFMKENESFICARESILKNFKIRAIVLMGNKTFGATGTNTVVLFLEKYNEPPKKADLIEDSIDAVFNGCNLDGWEDKAILEQYLKKIDVSSEVYERFLSEAVDIGDIEDKYFLKYKEAFLALSKTKEKQKQKTFGKLSEKEQKKLLTKQYYQYVKKIEREKMKYFSFVYDQRTLIVAAPDDNKGQEKFLGYKWSNRKGQEGIQIIDEGGMLYDAENRMSDRTIASLIRKMFNGEEVSLDDLEEYYYYLHTKDMISFSEVYFNKAIKTTKTRLLKDDPGLTAYSLSDEKTFDITIGDRVLSEEIVSGGRVPVYSANVYEEFGRIDKENMKDYSRPSVIWGIDGDWMVNIIPAGVPFYPTDHCGVLRIKTEKILPEYMMYALQAEGEYERFSRNNRASAQRIRSLVVQAPETKIQKNIIDELKALDDKINGQNAEIEKYENSIRTKFDQIFHLEEFISDGVFSKYEGYSVEDLCIDGRGRVINQQYIENHKGPYPVYSSQTTNDGIFGSIDTFDFDGEYITWTTDGAKAGTVFYRNGKFNCTNVCGTLKAKNDKVNMRYLAYLLNRIAYKFVSRVGNNKLMNDAMKKIVVPVPKRQLQDEFADFVQSVEKSKFECIGKKEKFEIEKDTFVHKYFR